MILDTNSLSALMDEDPELMAVLPSDRPWLLPVITIGEYRYGLCGSMEREQREQWLAELIAVVEVLPVILVTTEYYGYVRHELKKAHRVIPANDSWIAALALEHNQPVLSRDAHFDYVPGVVRIPW